MRLWVYVRLWAPVTRLWGRAMMWAWGVPDRAQFVHAVVDNLVQIWEDCGRTEAVRGVCLREIVLDVQLWPGADIGEVETECLDLFHRRTWGARRGR